ncbi:MAG: CAP domain-containing protein [Solirubrobacterales bacterium]
MARKFLLAISIVALVGVLFAGPAQARRLSLLIAPTSVCANQTDLGDSVAVQEQAMRCMTNYARRKARMHDLGNAANLDRSAADKNHDIIRCDEFSHYACGRPFTYWIQRSGYLASRCWRAGENIAWGSGDLATVRAIFTAWVHSPEHLSNILGRYSQIGIALKVGRLGHVAKAHVWTQDFGSHCGATSKHHRVRVPQVGLRLAYRAR